MHFFEMLILIIWWRVKTMFFSWYSLFSSPLCFTTYWYFNEKLYVNHSWKNKRELWLWIDVFVLVCLLTSRFTFGRRWKESNRQNDGSITVLQPFNSFLKGEQKCKLLICNLVHRVYIYLQYLITYKSTNTLICLHTYHRF